MTILAEWFRRLWYMLNRRRMDRDLQREMAFHREMMGEDSVRFGNTLRLREEARDVWGGTYLDDFAQDLRYSSRSFARTPAFTITATLTIAIGIGASTAVFSVVDRILFRSLPYPDSERLVSVGMMTPADTNELLRREDYQVWRSAESAFESMTSFAVTGNAAGTCDLTEQNPIRVTCPRVDRNFLSTFRVVPVLGRDFGPGDDDTSTGKVALVSYGLWRERFGAAPDVIGRTVSLDAELTTIVGVLPPDFEMPTLGRPELLRPLVENDAIVRAFARLKPGVSIQQARDSIQALFEESLATIPTRLFPADRVTLEVRSLRDRRYRDVRVASYLLFAAVLVVMVIACTNVANLLMARDSARHREFAVRTALGAGRARLIRQTVTASLLLSVVGGAAGCVLGWVMLRFFTAAALEEIPLVPEATLDGRVFLFTIVVSAATGLAFGLVPAVRVSSFRSLRIGGSVGTARTLGRQLLVSGQLALSLVLLTGAGLLLRTVWNIQSLPLGMTPGNVVTVSVQLGPQEYGRPDQQFAFFSELESRLESLDSIGSLAFADSIPLGSGGTPVGPLSGIEIEGYPESQASGTTVVRRRVSSDYFSVLEIPILRGRSFTDRDREADVQVVILSEMLASRLFPDDNPIGKLVRPGDETEWTTVVGTAGNVRNNPTFTGMDDPEWYFPLKNDPAIARDRTYVLLRMDSAALSDVVRSEVAAIDPFLPVTIEPMERNLSKLTGQTGFVAMILSSFAVAGALLATIGLYGVVSFLVTQRTQEIGLRTAIGATAADVMKLIVVRNGLWPALVGLIVGVASAAGLSRFLSGLLFEVAPTDFASFFGGGVVLVLMSLVASCIPAWRAVRIDPLQALRCE